MKNAWAILPAILLAGCTVEPVHSQAQNPSAQTQPAQTQPVVADDTVQVLDCVIPDWLRANPGDRPPQVKVAVLLGMNLPAGYEPLVAGWIVLRVGEADPHAPPTKVRKGDVEYLLQYHSSYVREEKLAIRVARRGDPPPPPPPPPPTRIEQVTDPVVLQIDKLRINGDMATVEISQNRLHNLGGSGATYQLTRTKAGWKLVPGKGMMWMN